MSKHYRLSDREPSAIITVAGNEKKLYDNGQIFLKNGDNFEIRFFNPLQEKVGVEILFNGQKKNNGLLVLNPGQDVTLDRFLDEKKKMKFDTYTIDGSNKAAVKAAEINGLVEFRFYKESNSYHYSLSNQTKSKIRDWSDDDIYKEPEPIDFSGFNGSFNGWNGTLSISGCTTISDSANSRCYTSPGIYTQGIDNSIVLGGSDTNTCFYSSTSDITLDGVSDNIAFNTGNIQGIGSVATPTKSAGLPHYGSTRVETGRIETGEESVQGLNTVDAQFESTPFHTITYQMKPDSHKPQEISEVRNYCKCGYRVRKNSWKFCPKCSEKL